jgi:uncharacterized protein (DUF1501 family)
MAGGASQMDTFDLKPGHANGGPFKEIQTSAPGLKISEHLPNVAKFGDKMAVIRSMSTKEGDHVRALRLLRTGYPPQGSVNFPQLGALVAKEVADDKTDLPPFVSIGASPTALDLSAACISGSGFLDPRYAPLLVSPGSVDARPPGLEALAKALRLSHATAGVSQEQDTARDELRQLLDRSFSAGRGGTVTAAHQAAHDQTVRLMRSAAARAFDLEEEPVKLRESYGTTKFGQGCLLARRLVERGVPFVEVTLGKVAGAPLGWDTHYDNFKAVRALSAVLDPAWAALLADLKERGLLDSTLVVWMGEFGRSPRISIQGYGELPGRDHHPGAWTTVLTGGGIKGGQVVGKTSKDGTTVEERAVSEADFLATVLQALGIDHSKENPSDVGRPVPLAAPTAKPIKEIVG